MKKVSLLIIIGLLFSFSCKKESVDSNNLLTGEWRWVSSTGGIAGVTITPASAGYERILLLTSDSKYSRYKNNVLEKTGTFEIIKAKSIYKIELVDFIKYDDGTRSVINVTGSELSLADNNYDGFGETFKRYIK